MPGFIDAVRGSSLLSKERLLTMAFLFGFVWDNLTLTRIDFWFDQLVLFVHLTIVISSIILIQFIASGRSSALRGTKVASSLPYLIQFSFGALFSGYLVYYFRSASLSASWPFIIILLALIAGNEFFRERYRTFLYQIGVFFFVLFSFLIFQVPIVLGKMGAWIFVLSGALSLIGVGLLLGVISIFARGLIHAHWRALTMIIGGTYALMHLLYFTNLIPPIPLSMKTIIVAHSVERVGSVYRVEYEPPRFFEFWRENSNQLHLADTDQVAVFAAVFAPTDLTTTIFHRYERYSDTSNRFITTARVPYTISGGARRGYRGYTEKTAVTPGRWRVSVETARGQVIGRTYFTVRSGEPELVVREE